MVKQSLRPNAKVKQCLIQSMTTGLLLLLFTAEVVMFFAEMPVWLQIFPFWPAPSNMSPNRRYIYKKVDIPYDIKKKFFRYCCEQMFVT